MRSRPAVEHRLPFFFLVGLAAILIGCRSGSHPPEKPADLVLRGGKIVTMNASRPEAEALAVRGDTVVAVGATGEIDPLIAPSTRVIELGPALAIPGFIEGHAHFLSIGNAKLQLDLTHAHNWDEIVAMVQKAVERTGAGELIQGRGWHQEKWDRLPDPGVDGLPVHHSLSEVSPDNPVVLRHASGHSSMANAKAMELAGITADTPDPPGGEIVKDRAGNPIGLFRENAQGLLPRPVQRGSVLARKKARLAADECLSKGITSFHDAGSGFETVDLLKRMAEEGSLGIRLWVMLNEPNERLARHLEEYRIIDAGQRGLTVRAIKRVIDGALGSHGAWLLEPYSDMPGSTGLNTTSIEDLNETARLAIEGGFQLCVHAIGDRANRETLDIFEKTFASHPDKKDLRWRIEHAQHLHPEDIPRFAQLGVIASMQGIHCTSDGPWVPLRLGEKRSREGAYVWRKLLDSGAVVTNGTDAPVEDVDPLACFFASVTRRMKNGEAFYPEQRMSRQEALRAYTLSNAYAAFEEEFKGSLSPGKLADITVLDRDIMTIPSDEIPTTEVLYTIVGGKVMYRKAER